MSLYVLDEGYIIYEGHNKEMVLKMVEAIVGRDLGTG
jgi:hypothetical protein